MGPPLSKYLLYQRLRACDVSGHLGMWGENHITRRVLGAGFSHLKRPNHQPQGLGVESPGLHRGRILGRTSRDAANRRRSEPAGGPNP
jgi:hypothetical protein